MKNLINFGKKIFPICRSITGQGTLKTLEEIKKKHLENLKIKKIPCGKKVFDWKIPPEWNVADAYILDKNNKKIVDFKKNNLHLVGYSKKTFLTLNKKNLLKKLHSLKKYPNAIT